MPIYKSKQHLLRSRGVSREGKERNDTVAAARGGMRSKQRRQIDR
jgi:hypothetical protein